jgi:hypothetical protein
MRPVAICATFLSVLACHASEKSLTVVLDFQTPPNDQSVSEMKREFESVMKRSDLRFDYKTRAQAEQIESDDLVVIRFTGECALKPSSDAADRGVLGFSYIMDGRVQPFGEIGCDRVIRAVCSAMSAADYLKSDQLLGRALGRVLAHEVVHMLTQSGGHARDGVAYKELTGRQLIALELRLQPSDFAHMRRNP